MPEPAAAPLPVKPRPAASLLVFRKGELGVEVLMGLRGAGHRFMPNRLVYPGGGVDPADHDAVAASELPNYVDALLRRHAAGSLARALAIAAARELEEETGLSLGNPPALGHLDYIFRAITPPASPIRFDAVFFVVEARHVSGELAGSGELEGLRFYPLDEAFALDLAFATKAALERLTKWLAMAPDERAARTTAPYIRERKWIDG